MSDIKIGNVTFSTYLNETVKADQSVADRCQVLIETAHAHMESLGSDGKPCNDSRYFDKIMNAPFRATRKEDMNKYIKAHTWLKLSKVDPSDIKSDTVYKKDPNTTLKTSTIPFELKEDGSIKTWYEFTGNKVVTDLDVDQAVKALIKRISDAAIEHKDGRKVKGSEKHAISVMHKLEKIAA